MSKSKAGIKRLLLAGVFAFGLGPQALAQAVVTTPPTQAGPTFPYLQNEDSGYFVLGAQNTTNLTTVTTGASTVRYFPFTVPQPIPLTQLGIIVTTAQASDSCNVGIYNDTKISGVDTPNALLVSTGALSTASVSNLVSAAAVITLQPNTTGSNIYWVATICNSTTATFRAVPVGAVGPGLGFAPGAANAYYVETASGTGTTLPATAAGPFTLGTGAPIAVVGVQ